MNVNTLRRILTTPTDFEEMKAALEATDVVLAAQSCLPKHRRTDKAARVALSAWIVARFTSDFEAPAFLAEKGRDVIKSWPCALADYDESVDAALVAFNQALTTFRQRSRQDLVEALAQQYHQAKIEGNETRQARMLHEARQLAGQEAVDAIKASQAVMVDANDMYDAATRALRDVMVDELAGGNPERLLSMLRHVVTAFCTLAPTRAERYRDRFDLNFLQDQLKHGVAVDTVALGLQFVETLEELQPPVLDVETQRFKERIRTRQLDLASFAIELAQRVDSVVKTVAQLTTR